MEERQQILELLQKMERNSRKQLFTSRIQCLFSLIALVCCLVILINILTLLPQIELLAQEANVVLTNLQVVTEELADLNLQGMITDIDDLVITSQKGVNAAVSKIEQIDFETLNEAIADLSSVIEPLAKLSNLFR